MIIISFFDRESIDKILLDLYGWTVIVTIGTVAYYGILYVRNRKEVLQAGEYKKILKIVIIILIGLFVIPAVINFGFGKPSFYFNKI